MKMIFSTADVHPRDAYDYWHEVLCRELIEHDCVPKSQETFGGELKGGAIADMHLVRHETSPMCVRLTQRHVNHANAEELHVVRQEAGRHLIEQAGHEVLLEPGDITIMDPRWPMSAKHLEGSRPLLFRIPRRELEARIGKTRQLATVSIKSSRPAHALTSAFLQMLPTYADALDSATANIVRDQTLDLIAVSLATAMNGETPRVSSARALVLVKVRAVIEGRLADPTLDAETVAAVVGVSVRYANAVLADAGTSIMHLVRTRRLERCRRALQDPSQAGRTISDIAYGWGFSDMTHFSRSFRAAFGSLPSEYRRQAESQAP